MNSRICSALPRQKKPTPPILRGAKPTKRNDDYDDDEGITQKPEATEKWKETGEDLDIRH